jgi:Fe-S cluster biosynthesis and repair protein YggX
MRVWMSSVLPFLLLQTVVFAASGQTLQTDANLIVARMTLRNSQRETLLGTYSGMRRYIFQNDGMQKHAEILVHMTGGSDGSKHFEVIKEEGWKAANKHVLRKMLLSEEETSESAQRARIRLTQDNYSFRLEGTDEINGRSAFVLDVLPKRQDKYLVSGRVWVDADDYAVVKVEGEPAKTPSFWTRSVHFVQTYRKDGVFWFPVRTESVTQALIFGKTEVSIDYFDYEPVTQTALGAPTLQRHLASDEIEDTENRTSRTDRAPQN